MDEHHVLPPLVRGKLRGFLNFFIDEVKIFKNISNSKECEVVVQVQWWGDPSPALVRPKEFLVCQKKMKYLCQKTYYHCVNYEVKTDFSLFHNYLKASEVLELAVLEVFKNIFIGSAFLRNLVKIIEQCNDHIVFPIVDYLGETIGEMKVHADYIAKNSESSTNGCLEERENLIGEPDRQSSKSSSFKDGQKLFEERNCNQMQECLFSPQNLKWFQNCNDLDGRTKICKPAINNAQSKNKEYQDSSIQKNTENQLTSKKLEHNFPQVEVYSDFSKVLSFPLKKANCKSNSRQAEPKFKSCNSLKKNHINAVDKSITHALSNIKLDNSPCKKKLEPAKKITKNKSEICRKAELSFKKNYHSQEKLSENDSVQLSIPRVSPISLPSSITSDNSASLPKSKSLIVPRENNKNKVLDYLLGFDMNYEEEHEALNDLKKMSPCQNFVETVSELFATPKSTSRSLDGLLPEKNGRNEKAKKTFKNLKFNFDDPIERKYYETFFTGGKSSIDFEIARMLNQPESLVLSRGKEAQERMAPLISDTSREEEDETKKVVISLKR